MGYVLQFDWHGNVPENRLSKTYFVPVVDATNSFCIVPPCAPFFESSITVTGADGAILQKGTDYTLGHPFDAANAVLTDRLFGSLIFSANGNRKITVTGQALGGPYTTTVVQNVTPFSNPLASLTGQKWEQVTGATPGFTDPYFHKPMDEASQASSMISTVSRFMQQLPKPYGRLDISKVKDFSLAEAVEQQTQQSLLKDAIVNHSSLPSLYHETIGYGPSMVAAIGSQVKAAWFDTGLTMEAMVPGWFIVNWELEARIFVIVAGSVSYREATWNDNAVDSSGIVFPLTWSSVVRTKNGYEDLTWETVALLADSVDKLLEIDTLLPGPAKARLCSRIVINGQPAKQSCCNGARFYLRKGDVVSLQGYISEVPAANVIINDAAHKTSMRMVKID